MTDASPEWENWVRVPTVANCVKTRFSRLLSHSSRDFLLVHRPISLSFSFASPPLTLVPTVTLECALDLSSTSLVLKLALSVAPASRSYPHQARQDGRADCD